MIIAVDFDGTCVTHRYPEVGEEIGAAEILKKLTEAGHQIILYTMRSGKELDDAVRWFVKHEIPLFGVNGNPTQYSWTTSPKPYAHIYIDDAALGCPLIHPANDRPYVDWKMVRHLFGI